MKTRIQLLARINLILSIAKFMAKKVTKETGSFMVENRVEEISIHGNGYAEPGYDASKSYNIIAVGNWNKVDVWDNEKKERVSVSNLPERIGRMFDKMGVPCEWSDEWVDCNDCGKLLRTEPDGMWWEPSFTVDDNGAHCKECKEKDTIPYFDLRCPNFRL